MIVSPHKLMGVFQNQAVFSSGRVFPDKCRDAIQARKRIPTFSREKPCLPKYQHFLRGYE